MRRTFVWSDAPHPVMDRHVCHGGNMAEIVRQFLTSPQAAQALFGQAGTPQAAAALGAPPAAAGPAAPASSAAGAPHAAGGAPGGPAPQVGVGSPSPTAPALTPSATAPLFSGSGPLAGVTDDLLKANVS